MERFWSTSAALGIPIGILLQYLPNVVANVRSFDEILVNLDLSEGAINTVRNAALSIRAANFSKHVMGYLGPR